jgi:hypothetical protein
LNNKNKKSRLSVKKDRRDLSLIFSLDKLGNRKLFCKIGLPIVPFFTVMARCAGNGLQFGICLFFLQFSFGYVDFYYPTEPNLQYGLYWRGKQFALYLPHRYPEVI